MFRSLRSWSARGTRQLFFTMLAALVASAATVIAVSPALFAAVRAPFEPPRFTTNDTGDIDIVGNTLMSCPLTANNCQAARDGGSANNNDFSMEFVDIDGAASTFNSSSAEFNLPVGGEVLFAGLYWGARENPDDPGGARRDRVSFGTPAPGGYQTLDGQIIGSFAAGGSGNVQAYHAFENVTDLVRQGGSGTYTVGNVQAQEGQDRYAGWSLVVAYRQPGAPPRNLTVFDGFADVTNTPNDRIVDVPIDGFQAPPTGPVEARLGLVSYEGDRALTGDSLQFRGGNQQNFTTISDQLNPANNFFNSTITRGGVRTGPGGKNPDYVNQLGYDVDVVDASDIIPNGATSATLRLTTDNDTYFPGVVTTAIELYAPSVELEKSVTDLNGGRAQPGDILEYEVTATNNGQDEAQDVVLTDLIPDDTSYEPGSLEVTQGANAGAKTDAAGDDQAEFAAASDRVVFRLGAGADAVNGGTLAPVGSPGRSSTIAFQVEVLPSASGTLIRNQASADYFGPQLDQDFNGISNPVFTPVGPSADLAIDKDDDPDPVRVGSRFTYTLTVTNNGPNPAPGVTVSDKLPNAVGFVRATPSQGDCEGPGRARGGTVTCDLGLIPRDGTATIEIVVEASGRAGEVINTASVDGLLPDRNPNNNDAVEETTIIKPPPPPCADLSVKVTAPNEVKLGQNFAYTVTARNLGPADVDDAVLTSRLPSGVKFVRASPGCRYDRATDKVTCDLGNVAAGTQKQRRIVVKAQEAGTVRLQGCAVKSGTADCDSSNNQLGSAGTRSDGREQSQAAPGVGPETKIVKVQEGSS